MQTSDSNYSYNLWRLYAAGTVFSNSQPYAEEKSWTWISSYNDSERKEHRELLDAYKLLGCSPQSKDDQVKSAFRRLAKRWHPDCARESLELAANKFRMIRAAYEVIFAARSTASA